MYRRPVSLRLGPQSMIKTPSLRLIVTPVMVRGLHAPKAFGLKPKADLRIVPKEEPIEVGHADEVLPPATFEPMQDRETSTPVEPITGERPSTSSYIVIEEEDDDAELLVAPYGISSPPRRGWARSWLRDLEAPKIVVGRYVLQDYLRYVLGDDRTIRYYLNRTARELARDNPCYRYDSRRDIILLIEDDMIDDLMELISRYGRWVSQDISPGLRAIRFSDNNHKNYVVTLDVVTRTLEHVYTAAKFERFMCSEKRSSRKRRLVNTARRQRRFAA